MQIWFLLENLKIVPSAAQESWTQLVPPEDGVPKMVTRSEALSTAGTKFPQEKLLGDIKQNKFLSAILSWSLVNVPSKSTSTWYAADYLAPVMGFLKSNLQ